MKAFVFVALAAAFMAACARISVEPPSEEWTKACEDDEGEVFRIGDKFWVCKLPNGEEVEWKLTPYEVKP